MFDVEQPDEVERFVMGLADRDHRVTAAAVVGSRAHGAGDRWSDLDLTFAVTDATSPMVLLDEWTAALQEQFAAAALFDLPAGPITYRVFLLPGALQVDVSVTPSSKFAARGDAFRLVFGSANIPSIARERDTRDMFGRAVHHAVRAHVAIQRGQWLQAEYWISGLRDEALALASRRAGVADYHARGAHLLPEQTQSQVAGALVLSLEPRELARALTAAVALLLDQADQAPLLADRVGHQLHALATSTI